MVLIQGLSKVKSLSCVWSGWVRVTARKPVHCVQMWEDQEGTLQPKSNKLRVL